jgi:hypothetical protein
LETQPPQASTCDIAISIRESQQGLAGLCLYKATLFDATTIMRLLADFERLLHCFVSQPEQTLLASCALCCRSAAASSS